MLTVEARRFDGCVQVAKRDNGTSTPSTPRWSVNAGPAVATEDLRLGDRDRGTPGIVREHTFDDAYIEWFVHVAVEAPLVGEHAVSGLVASEDERVDHSLEVPPIRLARTLPHSSDTAGYFLLLHIGHTTNHPD